MPQSPLKLLFIRLDKIGDLVCTLPCDQHPWLIYEGATSSSTSHTTLSNSNASTTNLPVETFWIIQKGNEFILENALPARKFLALDKSKPKESQQQLSAFLKEHRFDVAFSFQSPWWVNWALFKAKIPQRFGVLSQWHSFLFLNQGLRQKRSRAEKHEADYNFEIVDYGVRKLLSQGKVSAQKEKTKNLLQDSTPVLKMQAPENPELLQKWNLKPASYFVVHPGMAGSALNWHPSQYIEFIEGYLKQFSDNSIVLTGTPMDEAYLADIKTHFAPHPRVKVLQNQISTRELLSLLKSSCGLLAPSTGVLHLAASLGVPCYGIYSPIRVQHPRRWAARGEKVSIFLPSSLAAMSMAYNNHTKTDTPVTFTSVSEVTMTDQLKTISSSEVSTTPTSSTNTTSATEVARQNCPATFKCLKENCPKFNCMKEVLPSTILNNISKK